MVGTTGQLEKRAGRARGGSGPRLMSVHVTDTQKMERFEPSGTVSTLEAVAKKWSKSSPAPGISGGFLTIQRLYFPQCKGFSPALV